MKIKTALQVIVFFLALQSIALMSSNEVSFKAADGVTVYAEYSPASVAKSRGLIVLFHQASGSRAEYATISPKLNSLGFETLAVDQRSGGNMFGTPNKTSAGLNKPSSYLDALPDLEASLTFARTQYKKEKVIVWGSSYSAALVFLLAAKQSTKISAVVAFSPGEYLGKPNLVRDAAKQVVNPVFIASSASEVAEAKAIFNALPTKDKIQFIPKGVGTHGSSVLNNALTRAEYWVAVEQFLARYK